MKKRCAAFGLLLSLLLSLTGCGGMDVGVIGGEDGPTGVYVGSNTFTFGGDEDREEDPAGPDSNDPAPAGPETADPEPADPAPTGPEESEPIEAVPAPVEEDGTYNSAEDVSLYLYLYGHLPDNYITKAEARELGWSGGSVEQVAPGCAIGGDRFGNREGVLPEGSYHECDIDTIGRSSRGAKRLVYEDEGEIYYTEDHYETFTPLLFYTEEDGSLTVSFGEE